MPRRKKSEEARPVLALAAAIDEETSQPLAQGGASWYSGPVPPGVDPGSQTGQRLYRAQLAADWESAIETRARAERAEAQRAIYAAEHGAHTHDEVIALGFFADDVRTARFERLMRQVERNPLEGRPSDPNLDVSFVGTQRSRRDRRAELESATPTMADVDDLRRSRTALAAQLAAWRHHPPEGVAST